MFLINKNLFNEKLTRGQETELFSRLFFEAHNSSYKILNIPLFLYRIHDKRKSNENNKYIKSYKESQSYTAVELFTKSIVLKDVELVQAFYIYLINSFFRSLENKHNSNAKFILNKLREILKFNNVRLSFEIVILGSLFLFFSRGVYKIEKNWKLKEIKI